MGGAIIQLLAYTLVLAVNYLANALPLNGQTTGEVSNKLNVLFTPAGYVFSIWGLIYLLLGIWVILQFPKRRRDLPMYRTTRALFVLSCILNSLWIFMWHYEFFAASVVVILLLLLTLIRLYKKLVAMDATFFQLLPFSVYLGWVSVAVIANISYYLKYMEWSGFGIPETIWVLILLIVGTWLALYMLIAKGDPVYPLVFVWAFIGIGVRNQNMGVPLVEYGSYFFAVVIFLAVIAYAFSRKWKFK